MFVIVNNVSRVFKSKDIKILKILSIEKTTIIRINVRNVTSENLNDICI